MSIFELKAIGNRDMFVQKLDSLGNFVWAKSIGGTDITWGWSITNDLLGGIYVCGRYSGSVDFDPGADVEMLTSQGADDAFILKLDTDGDFMWAKSIGSTEVDIAYSIVTDQSQNVLVTGWYEGTVDFDSGVNTYNLTSKGYVDAYVLKLDSEGNFVWAGGMGGNSGDAAHSLATDFNDNIIIAGFFSGTADMDPSIGTFNLTSNGSNDIAIVKLDSKGDFLWAKALGGLGTDRAITTTVDLGGNIYVSGVHNSSIDFDPGPDTFFLEKNGSFVLKLDTLGNFLWAKSIGGTIGAVGHSIGIDSYGNFYATGKFRDTTDFNYSGGGYEVSSMGLDDGFIIKLDPNGDFLWVESFGGEINVNGYCIDIDVNNNIFIGGYYTGIADFDPSGQAYNLSSNGSEDFFILKLGNFNFSTGERILTLKKHSLIYPNPFRNYFNIITGQTGYVSIKVYNMDGVLLLEKGKFDSIHHPFKLNQPAGFYVLEIIHEDKRELFRLMKKD
jgi:hypothetical protein